MTQIVDRSGFVPDALGLDPLPLDGFAGGPALMLTPEDDPADAVPHFSQLRLIVLCFDSFADGRGFSMAAQLRRLGYGGHLRARGPLLVDQFRAALRCGFDDIEIPQALAARMPAAQWQAVPHGPGYLSQLF